MTALIIFGPLLVLMVVWIIWGVSVFISESLYTGSLHWRFVGHRTRRRNCPTCRDHYPVCWLEPCRERGHAFGYDCTGLADHIMLCQKHEDQYWHIQQMEKELL